ncbi:MAG: hypothetical protein L0241_24455 [Planctomycetia bacterium]|nr:hypothetical protein [Planctomycetia bacterium]
MSRKATSKKSTKTTAKKKTTTKTKSAPKPKSKTVYTVQREISSEFPTHTEPERIFMDKSAAQRFADERNKELRAVTNPFRDNWPDYMIKGGTKALVAVFKKLKLTPPTKKKDEYEVDWEGWWDRNYFNMTDAQRDAIWNALNKYNFYKVTTTTLE